MLLIFCFAEIRQNSWPYRQCQFR